MIWLIGRSTDEDLLALKLELETQGNQVSFFELGHSAESYRIEWRSPQLPLLGFAELELSISHLEQRQAALFKVSRTDNTPLIDVSLGDSQESAFARREWRAAVLAALTVLLDTTTCRTYGSPRDLTWQDWKLVTLWRASAAGIAVPRTLIAQQFSPNDLPAQVVAKAINGNPSIDSERFFGSTLLQREILDDVLQTRTAVPSYLQDVVDRDFEARVVVLGDSSVARAIYANFEAGEIDVRYAADITVEPVELSIERDLVRLCKALSIGYSCFDIIVDRAGTEWLVDATPQGSWFWLDEAAHSKRSVTRVVADILTGGGYDSSN